MLIISVSHYRVLECHSNVVMQFSTAVLLVLDSFHFMVLCISTQANVVLFTPLYFYNFSDYLLFGYRFFLSILY